ncbi:LAQU0S07e03290g1_1 [Lachancea quebecensis]|uniref:LAQU0S07e03290g1_1 n=1 Tax=Lachancea quebecensis TaxID=1654605 RepID=A0A0P1KSV1_9SACH|nr:LAQU0S07e03290g1_1 [Lachancea quebecensis]
MGNLFDLSSQLAFYKSYHSDSINVMIHAIFVPTILYSSMVLLYEVKAFDNWTVAHLLVGIFSSYYMILDVKAGALASAIMGCTMHGISSGCLQVSIKAALALFFAGWVSQFIGHGAFEHRKPALLDNLVQSLITAPFLILFELLFRMGFYQELKAELMARVKERRSHMH